MLTESTRETRHFIRARSATQASARRTAIQLGATLIAARGWSHAELACSRLARVRAKAPRCEEHCGERHCETINTLRREDLSGRQRRSNPDLSMCLQVEARGAHRRSEAEKDVVASVKPTANHSREDGLLTRPSMPCQEEWRHDGVSSTPGQHDAVAPPAMAMSSFP